MNNIYKHYLRPALILLMVCVVVSGLLTLTYHLAGIKELGKGFSDDKLSEFAANALPKADRLIPLELTVEDKAFISAYKAENGAGTAFIVKSKGYGGDITAMVGFGADGTVQGIHIISATETPGIGDRVLVNEEFMSQFKGASGEIDVDTVTGATVTSKGVIKLCQKAMELYEINGGR